MAPPLPTLPSQAEDAKIYRMGAGDVVSITVFPVDEYSRETTVQPDGMIELSLIGGVLVKGLTSKELQLLLEQKYVKFVSNPKVSVSVRRFSGRRVAIIGEIRSPGYYEYRDGMKLLELVSLAGGLTDLAKPTKVRILRMGDPNTPSFLVDVQAILDGETSRNPLMASGDTVYIPKGKNTKNVMWINANILPWLSLMTLISSVILLVHSNTGASGGN
jgi:polysaccharide export outer membrane protein